MCMADLSEQAALVALEERLTSMYSDISRDRISLAVQAAHHHFEDSRIRDFVPLFVERRAREQLAAADQMVSAGA